MNILKGSGDGNYPYILTIANGWGEKIHLLKSEIRHNLRSISIQKVYEILDCKIKLTKEGDLVITDKYRCSLLGLKFPSKKRFSIDHVYLELKERKVGVS